MATEGWRAKARELGSSAISEQRARACSAAEPVLHFIGELRATDTGQAGDAILRQPGRAPGRALLAAGARHQVLAPGATQRGIASSCRSWRCARIGLVERGLLDVRSSLGSGHPEINRRRQQRARSRHARATSAASLSFRLYPSTIWVEGVLLAGEQRRLAAIVTADAVGYSHAADEQIWYSSLMPRTCPFARLLETLDR